MNKNLTLITKLTTQAIAKLIEICKLAEQEEKAHDAAVNDLDSLTETLRIIGNRISAEDKETPDDNNDR